ncbi:hypothetical protein [Siphonobacter sp.]|uniref:hypothetical protein n=1 Tax=Siphonobacter sp. TaxID=1869184 RepID=UPI003B3AB977
MHFIVAFTNARGRWPLGLLLLGFILNSCQQLNPFEGVNLTVSTAFLSRVGEIKLSNAVASEALPGLIIGRITGRDAGKLTDEKGNTLRTVTFTQGRLPFALKPGVNPTPSAPLQIDVTLEGPDVLSQTHHFTLTSRTEYQMLFAPVFAKAKLPREVVYAEVPLRQSLKRLSQSDQIQTLGGPKTLADENVYYEIASPQTWNGYQAKLRLSGATRVNYKNDTTRLTLEQLATKDASFFITYDTYQYYQNGYANSANELKSKVDIAWADWKIQAPLKDTTVTYLVKDFKCEVMKAGSVIKNGSATQTLEKDHEVCQEYDKPVTRTYKIYQVVTFQGESELSLEIPSTNYNPNTNATVKAGDLLLYDYKGMISSVQDAEKTGKQVRIKSENNRLLIRGLASATSRTPLAGALQASVDVNASLVTIDGTLSRPPIREVSDRITNYYFPGYDYGIDLQPGQDLPIGLSLPYIGLYGTATQYSVILPNNLKCKAVLYESSGQGTCARKVLSEKAFTASPALTVSVAGKPSSTLPQYTNVPMVFVEVDVTYNCPSKLSAKPNGLLWIDYQNTGVDYGCGRTYGRSYATMMDGKVWFYLPVNSIVWLSAGNFTQRLYINPDFAISVPLKSDLAQISDKTDNLVTTSKVDVSASTYYVRDFDMYSVRINVTEKSNCSY